MRTEKWMKNIPDETPLSMISIPGTHDSAARFKPLRRLGYFAARICP